MGKPVITVLHDKDGAFKVFMDGPNFVSIPDPESFVRQEAYTTIVEFNPAEFLVKWPRSHYDYKIVGSGAEDSKHVAEPVTQADVEKYGAQVLGSVPQAQREAIKQELLVQAIPNPTQEHKMEYTTPTTAISTGYAQQQPVSNQRLILVYTKMLAKASTLKGKAKAEYDAEVRGFKNGVLLVDSLLVDLLTQIEADIL